MCLRYRASMPTLVMFLTCMLLEQLIVPSGSNAANEEVVLATATAGIRITQADLDRVIQDYQRKSRNPTVTREQKIQLIRNLVRRELILQQDGIEALRKEPDIVRKIKQVEDGLVIEKFLGEHIGRYMIPDEAELKTYYRENRQRFSTPAMVEARHILLRDRPDAEQVAVKLRQGEDFIQLAKAYSIDLPLSETGGQMSALPIPKGEALPELDQVLFILEEGEVSDIVETQFGYHIIRVDKIIPPTFKSYEEVKDSLRKEIVMQRHNQAYNELAAQLEKDADVKIFEEQIQVP